jgi:hypothetical protein
MAAHKLRLGLQTGSDRVERDVTVTRLIIAGWTGRDPVAVEHHIAELEAIGVRRPATVPVFYSASAARLTTADAIEATGERSSGEVEFVLLQTQGRLWIGLGSDHTDREVETYGVTVSKQMCDKPIAPTFWAYDEVKPHWDRLTLRSSIVEGGKPVVYQEGSVAAMLEPSSLIERYTGGASLPEGMAMFCGTLAVKGGIRPAPRFDFQITDPVLGREIKHGYAIETLPVMG